MNTRRKQPIGDGKGITNGLMVLAPPPPPPGRGLGAVDPRKVRADCNKSGGVFDPRTGKCLLPEVDADDPNPTWDYQKKILLAGAAVAVLIILFRKER